MEAPLSSSSINKKPLLSFALWLSLVAITGLSGCGGHNSNDPDPTVSVASASIAEGGAGTTDLVFTISASEASDSAITLTYATSDGTAIAGNDYTETSDSVVIPAGSTSATITIPVIGDTVYEGDETLTLTLTAATGATLANATATGTILNDDNEPSVSIANASVAEGNSGSTDLIFTLTASGTSDTDISVTYETTAGTATAGTDYSETSGSAVIPAGSTGATITIPVTGDKVYEADETLTLTLKAATGATLSTASATASGTIQNDDSAPSVSIADSSVVEGNSGSTSLVFILTASGTSDTDISVTYATSDGIATDGRAIAGSDYVDTSGIVDIPSGSTRVTISVPVNGDTDIEDDETLTLKLIAATGATLGTASVTGTIVNDDHADPKGYYTGSATVKDPDNINIDLVLSDLKVLVSGNRMTMMSINGVIYYDAQITSIEGNDFTADVTIYLDMDQNITLAPVSSTMSGTITEGSRIEGTIAGTGAATGVFSVDYDSMSVTTADSADIAYKWNGYFNNRINATLTFTLDTSGSVSMDFVDQVAFGIFEDCHISGSVLPIASQGLFAVNFEMADCDQDAYKGNYTGFAIPASLENDTLILMFSNDVAAGFGELSVVVP